MKPFNIKTVLSDTKLITRDGREVSKIFYVPESHLASERIVCVINGEVSFRYESGRVYDNSFDTRDDLFIATEKREGWINIYPRDDGSKSYVANASDIHATKEIADLNCNSDRRIACIRIEWEE